jgi:hypothetical protein
MLSDGPDITATVGLLFGKTSSASLGFSIPVSGGYSDYQPWNLYPEPQKRSILCGIYVPSKPFSSLFRWSDGTPTSSGRFLGAGHFRFCLSFILLFPFPAAICSTLADIVSRRRFPCVWNTAQRFHSGLHGLNRLIVSAIRQPAFGGLHRELRDQFSVENDFFLWRIQQLLWSRMTNH